MNSRRWFLVLGLAVVPSAACGPDHRPEEPCEGPSFNLIVRAEGGPLPDDTRINVRYGGNPDGERYVLGKPRPPQAVSCEEDTSVGGASSEGSTQAGASSVGGASASDAEVWALRCGLYTQGPARLDVTATGYEPIADQALSFEKRGHCEVEVEVKLLPAKPDPG